MAKKPKHSEHHYRRTLIWRKLEIIAFFVFLIIFVIYKMQWTPESWNPTFNKLEIFGFVAVILTKGVHFYHRRMHCPKCKENLRSILKKDAHDWCDTL